MKQQGKYSRKGGKEDSDSEDHDEREESDEIDHSSEASEAESDDESPELECSRGLKAIESNKKHPPRPLDEDEEPETPLYLRIQKNLIDNERNAHQNTRVRKIKREKSAEGTHQIRKLHKNAPAVMPSNKPVRRLRVDANNSTRKFIDPRFSELSGKLDSDIFLKSYQFLDEEQEKEIQAMEKKLSKVKSKNTKESIREELKLAKQQLTERRRAVKVRERLNEAQRIEKEKVKSGIKKPFFLKESAKKQIALDVRYEELKESGRLNSFMNKKRKRNSSKDHRRVPRRRSEEAH